MSERVVGQEEAIEKIEKVVVKAYMGLTGIENNNIDAIIGLPANIFFGTGIPTIIMVLKQARNNTDVLLVDASKGFEKVGKNNKLRACDIKKIVDAVTQRADSEKFSRKVTRDEIRQNDYNLNIPRYVDSSEAADSWDIYASMFGGIPSQEITAFDKYWNAFVGLKESLFAFPTDGYPHIKVDNIKIAIQEHASVKAFCEEYKTRFAGFDTYLDHELLDAIAAINIPKEKEVLTADMFNRLKDMPLVDKYEAYQMLSDRWNEIANDIEIIQTEGLAAAKQVDPVMVIKKKNGKDEEVQDGWIGHIIPFELVQETFFADDLADIKKDEDRIAEIGLEYEETLEALPEEAKEKAYVNDDASAFVWKEVKAAIKAKEDDAETLELLKKANTLNEEEKKLKKQITAKIVELINKTIETIENLTEEQIHELLYAKWITPLMKQLHLVPENVVKDFAAKIEKLANKYSVTMSEVEEQISQTEKELTSMIDMLEGDSFDMQGLAELKKLLGGN